MKQVKLKTFQDEWISREINVMCTFWPFLSIWNFTKKLKAFTSHSLWRAVCCLLRHWCKKSSQLLVEDIYLNVGTWKNWRHSKNFRLVRIRRKGKKCWSLNCPSFLKDNLQNFFKLTTRTVITRLNHAVMEKRGFKTRQNQVFLRIRESPNEVFQQTNFFETFVFFVPQKPE